MSSRLREVLILPPPAVSRFSDPAGILTWSAVAIFQDSGSVRKNLQPVLQQCDEATHCEVTLDPQNTQINSKQFENNFYSPPKVFPLSPLAVFQMPSWSGQRQ